MKTTREWNDNPELFEAVMSALDHSDEFGHTSDTPFGEVDCRPETGGYGERGYIDIRTLEGKHFRLALEEIH